MNPVFPAAVPGFGPKLSPQQAGQSAREGKPQADAPAVLSGFADVDIEGDLR